MSNGYRAFLVLAAAGALVTIAGCKPAGTNAASAAAGAPAGSFVASGAAAQPASLPGGGSATFTDPTENAFAISVPQGWSVKGGVQRITATVAKPWVTATSPDGATTIMIGDPSIPGFTLPGPGRAEGSSVQTQGGARPVEAYENGAQFAADYAQRAWGQSCQLQQAGVQAEPDLAQQAQATAQQNAAAVGVGGSTGSYDGASALFSCQAGGGAKAFGVIDVTAESASQVGGFWGVPLLIAYSTPAASQAQTDQIARSMRQSYQVNPQWQAQMVATTRQQVASNNQAAAGQQAALTAQEGQEGAMIRQQGIQDQARLTNEHNAFMRNFNAQGAQRNAAWNQQMYNKETGQQAEMRYINNQTCIAWYDAAHTRCSATAQ